MRRSTEPAHQSTQALRSKRGAARYLNIQPEDIDALCRAGKLKAVTLPGRKREKFRIGDLDTASASL